MSLDKSRPYTLVVGRDRPSVFTQNGVDYYPDGRVLNPKVEEKKAEAKEVKVEEPKKELPSEPEKELPSEPKKKGKGK